MDHQGTQVTEQMVQIASIDDPLNEVWGEAPQRLWRIGDARLLIQVCLEHNLLCKDWNDICRPSEPGPELPTMKLSRTTNYALYGLSHLADQPIGRFVPVREISRRFRIPGPRLAKILQILVRAGMLRSSRGVRGGFALRRDASTIGVLEVVRLFEGGMGIRNGAIPEDDARLPVDRLFGIAGRGMLRTLDRLTIADLAKRESPEDGPKPKKKPGDEVGKFRRSA